MLAGMRWRFPDPEDTKEQKARERVEKKIDAFWAALVKRSDDLDALFSRRASWDLPAFMARHLGAVHEDLRWEFGPARKGHGHRLVITPEGEHVLVPLVEAMLARAPRLRGWEFYGGRQAETGEWLTATIEGRTGRPMPKTKVGVSAGAHGRIDLVFELAGLSEQDAEATAILLAETMLGEDVLDTWIGAITVEPPSKKRRLALDAVPAAVEAAIAAVQKALPKKPAVDRLARAQWTLFQGDPPEAEDYADQDDLFVAPTMVPEVFQAVRAPGYSDRRFSRHGEVFAYVKIDGRKGLTGSRFTDRDDIQEALDKVLVKPRLGAVVGGGTGRIYSYVELALLDPKRALPKIRKVLRDGGLPLRSWILFHDPTLADEWLGIHPKTKPPPRP